MNNPNIKRDELERLSVGAVQYGQLQEKYNNLRNQLMGFGSIFKTQLNNLKSKGVKF